MKFLISFISIVSMAVGLASCDCDHNLEEPYPFKLGWIVCTDGEVISFCDYTQSDKEAIAIVYHVVPDHNSPIAGYAVYLDDRKSLAFADSLNVAQGTSKDVSALDGNENTFAMYASAEEVNSPLANHVFDMWKFGQSAYIPSVAQLKQIYSVKDYINPRIEAIGGDILPGEPEECWYWSSTEVEGQDIAKAWLLSMQSGAMQETPKDQRHKLRPVITLYK